MSEAGFEVADPDVEIRPWVEPREIPALLRREARVLIAPSRWPEPGPLTVYEALAAGIPVITTATCGAAERVRHGIDGLISAPDVDALTSALDTMSDLGVARAMGAAAYDGYWRDPPTLAAHARQLIRLYEMIAVGRSDPSTMLKSEFEHVVGPDAIVRERAGAREAA